MISFIKNKLFLNYFFHPYTLFKTISFITHSKTISFINSTSFKTISFINNTPFRTISFINTTPLKTISYINNTPFKTIFLINNILSNYFLQQFSLQQLLLSLSRSTRTHVLETMLTIS